MKVRLGEVASELIDAKAQVNRSQVVMEKVQQDMRESRGREESLQGRLEKAELELKYTKAQVADLEEREAGVKVRLGKTASELDWELYCSSQIRNG